MKTVKIKTAKFPNIKKAIQLFIEFFKSERGFMSMGRLLAFMVILIMAFDAIWTLVVLEKVWEFTLYKALATMSAIGGKVAEKYITHAGGAQPEMQEDVESSTSIETLVDTKSEIK